MWEYKDIYYYYDTDEKIGPIDAVTLYDLASVGKIKPDTLILTGTRSVRKTWTGLIKPDVQITETVSSEPVHASSMISEDYFHNFPISRSKLALCLLWFLIVGFLFSCYLAYLVLRSGHVILSVTPVVLFLVIGGILYKHAENLRIFG